ncbi:MAG: type II toxin-antitoxin system VapB family antitoxin [Sphingomonas sp.]
MALSIKDETTDRLVRRYARLHGTSYTKAVNRAVTEALRREGQPVNDDDEGAEEDFLTFIHNLQNRVARHPILDDRSPDEIIGYDEHGLPK